MPQPASSPTTTATPRRRLHRPVLLIVGIMLIAANLRAALTSVGPLLEQIQQQLALSATAAGLINSLPLILFAVLSPLTPALAKRIGIERTGPRPCAAGLRHRATFPAARRHALAGQHPDRRRHCLRQRGAADAGEKRFPASRRRDDRRLCGGDVTGCRHRLRSGGAAGCPADLGWRFSLLCWGLPALLALLVWLPQLRRSATPATKEPQPTEPQRYRSPRGSALGWQVAMFMGLQSIAFYTIIGWFSAFAASHGTSAQQAGFELFVYRWSRSSPTLSWW